MNQPTFDFLEQERTLDWSEKLYAYYYTTRLLLKRFWWILLLCTMAGVAYQAYREMNRVPLFVSSGRLIISGRIALPEGSVYREELSNFFGTQITLMLSPRVQERARQQVAALHPEVRPGAVNLRAYQQPEASIFIAQAEGTEPRYTQLFLDAAMEEYINFRKEMRTQTSESTLQAITEQLIRLEDEITRQENELVEFQKHNNLVYLKEQGSSAGSYLSQLKNREAEIKTRLLLYERLGLATANAPSDAGRAPAGGEILNLGPLEVGRSYQTARQRLSELQAERSEYAQYLKPRHPKILALNLEIERTRNLLVVLEERAWMELGEQKDLLQKELAHLATVIRDWESTALDHSRRLSEFERLEARLDRSRGTYQRLLDSIQSINLNQKLEQETVAVLESAGPANLRAPAIRQEISKGALLGLTTGIGLLVLLLYLDNRIVSGEDLKKRFEQPVLGVIPKEKPGPDGVLLPLKPKDRRHLFAEAWRTIRSSLLFLRPDGSRPQVILVTSSIPEEGKSTVAANLAVAIALASSRTILIDADLRRGHLHRNFGKAAQPGLAEVLRGVMTFEQAVQPSGSENLDLLAVGEYPERPGELLLSARFDEVLQDLKRRYEFIIIDSAPLLATDDTSGISLKADALAFVVRSNYTQARQVKGSLERLSARGAKVAGFVLNCSDVRGSDYYYYRKYYSYYQRHST